MLSALSSPQPFLSLEKLPLIVGNAYATVHVNRRRISKLELPRSPAGFRLFVGCAWLGMKSSLSLATSIECDHTKFACVVRPCHPLVRTLVCKAWYIEFAFDSSWLM